MRRNSGTGAQAGCAGDCDCGCGVAWLRRLSADKAKAAEEEQQLRSNLKPEHVDAAFLQMTNKVRPPPLPDALSLESAQSVYLGGNETLEERLQRNKHYRQKGDAALRAETFL